MARWLLSATAICLFLVFGRASAAEDPLRPDMPDDYALQKLLVDTINQVERNYVKPIDRRKLIEAAIDGVLKQLDEYSDYVAPDDMSSFKTTVSQQFAGIGIQVADVFVSEGKIVSTEGRNVAPQVWEAEKRGTYEGFPMVVLVNRYSASASEIVSACLQDHQRAVVIGERTFGKGSVQKVIEMEGGQSALKLTTAGYHRPNGKNIDRLPGAKPEDDWGVKPNDGFELRLTDSEIVALLQYRRGRDILKPHEQASEPAPQNGQVQKAPPAGQPASDASEDARGQSPVEGFTDRQLKMAIDHLREKLTRQVAGESPAKPAEEQSASDALAEAAPEKTAQEADSPAPETSPPGEEKAGQPAQPPVEKQKAAVDGSQAP